MPSIRKTSSTDTTKTLSDSEAVDQFLKKLSHPLKEEVETLRRIILKADARIGEGIKWNGPSFCCDDWFATFDLRSKEWVQIILHRGAKPKHMGDSRYVKDPKAILKWITNDRGLAKFVSQEDVKSKATALTQVVAEWVKNMASEKHD